MKALVAGIVIVATLILSGSAASAASVKKEAPPVKVPEPIYRIVEGTGPVCANPAQIRRLTLLRVGGFSLESATAKVNAEEETIACAVMRVRFARVQRGIAQVGVFAEQVYMIDGIVLDSVLEEDGWKKVLPRMYFTAFSYPVRTV